jgi:hypothetical protein
MGSARRAESQRLCRGDELAPGGALLANYWRVRSAAIGRRLAASPVGHYPATAGLYDRSATFGNGRLTGSRSPDLRRARRRVLRQPIRAAHARAAWSNQTRSRSAQGYEGRRTCAPGVTASDIARRRYAQPVDTPRPAILVSGVWCEIIEQVFSND